MAEVSPSGMTEKRKAKKLKESKSRLISNTRQKRNRSMGHNTKVLAMTNNAQQHSLRSKHRKGKKPPHNGNGGAGAIQNSSRDKKRHKLSSGSMTHTQATSVSQLKVVDSKTRQKAEESRPDIAVPRKMVVKQNVVDDDDVKTFLIKLKENKKKEPVVPERKDVANDLKTQLVLDRMVKKKYPARYVSKATKLDKAESEDLLSTNTKKDTSEDKNSTCDEKEEKGGDTTNKKNADKADAAKDQIDTYDYVPKIEDVIKLPAENVMSASGLPHWMDYLEPTDDDTKDVEPSCPVGSEQIEMYHEKKIVLRNAPEAKITLDQWQYSGKLMSRDKSFFSYDLVFSNTLRSLINVASAGKKFQNKKDDEPEGVTQCEDDRILTWANLKTMKCHEYQRSDPLGTLT